MESFIERCFTIKLRVNQKRRELLAQDKNQVCINQVVLGKANPEPTSYPTRIPIGFLIS